MHSIPNCNVVVFHPPVESILFDATYGVFNISSEIVQNDASSHIPKIRYYISIQVFLYTSTCSKKMGNSDLKNNGQETLILSFVLFKVTTNLKINNT